MPKIGLDSFSPESYQPSLSQIRRSQARGGRAGSWAGSPGHLSFSGNDHESSQCRGAAVGDRTPTPVVARPPPLGAARLLGGAIPAAKRRRAGARPLRSADARRHHPRRQRRPTPLGGVGLVVGLEGPGEAAPEFRTMLEAELRKMGVKDAKAWASRPDAAVVFVTAQMPPGGSKGERIDVEVALTPHNKATNLRGGYLMECQLYNYDYTKNLSPNSTGPQMLLRGHPIAKAEGPVLVGFGEADEPLRRQERPRLGRRQARHQLALDPRARRRQTGLVALGHPGRRACQQRVRRRQRGRPRLRPGRRPAGRAAAVSSEPATFPPRCPRHPHVRLRRPARRPAR